MQKVVNVLAVASAAVSLAVVGTVGYVFVNKDAIIKGVTDKAMESVLGGGLGGGLGGAIGGDKEATDFDLKGGGKLPLGSSDLSPQTNPAATPQASALPEF